MIYLCLDTCSWINITQLDNDTIIKGFETLVSEEKIAFIVPELVITEFNNNLPKILDSLKNSYHSKMKNLNDMGKILDESDKENLAEIFNRYSQKLDELIAVHKDISDRINNLLNNGIKCVPSSSQKIEAADWASDKKAPFFNNSKNEMTDFYILLSALESSNSKNLKPFIFITHNVEDFSMSTKGEERKIIHENLNSFFDQDSTKYLLEPKITDLVNEIKPDLIKFEKAKKLEEELAAITTLNEMRRKCKHEYDISNGFWKPSMYGGGLSWHYLCKNCGIMMDTGEYFD